MLVPMSDEQFSIFMGEQLSRACEALKGMIASVFREGMFSEVTIDEEFPGLVIGDSGFSVQFCRAPEGDFNPAFWMLTVAVTHSNYPHAEDDVDVVEVEEFNSFHSMVVGVIPHLAKMSATHAWDNAVSPSFYDDMIQF